MRRTGVIFAIPFLACTIATGQSAPASPSGAPVPDTHWTVPGGSDPQKAPKFRDPALQARYFRVTAYLRFTSPLQGGDETLAGEGDEAAFFIYTLIASGPPLTSAQTLTALDIIHKSFASPVAIQNGQTKPTKSLALLKIIQASAVDQTVKERIAAETNYLNALPEKIVPTPIGIPGQPPPSGPVGLF